MTGSPPDIAARLRGTAAGSLTAALAVAAHASAGGALPTGAAVVQLAVLAITAGAVAARLRSGTAVPALLGLLSAGQLTAHLMLGVVGHGHAPSTAGAMLGAHIVAVAACVALIASAEHLCRALTRVLRAVVRVGRAPVPARAMPGPRRTDQPLRALMLARMIAHRGPPVGVVC